MKKHSFIFLLTLSLSTLSPKVLHATPVHWTKVGSDIHVTSLAAFSPSLVAPELTFVRTSLRDYEVKVLIADDYGPKRNSVQALAAMSKAHFVINANFFDKKDNPLGLVIARGLLRSKMHKGGQTLTGVFSSSPRGLAIHHRSQFEPTSIINAVQAGPRLLVDGKATALFKTEKRAQRAGLCIDTQGRLIFFCLSRWPIGISLASLQNILRSKPIGCVDALNLDGGASAQMILHPPGSPPLISIEGIDKVPVALALVPRQSSAR